MNAAETFAVTTVPPANSVLAVDEQQIYTFIDAIFLHADPDANVSLRSFADVGNATPIITSVPINNWEELKATASKMAYEAANDVVPRVFCILPATFSSATKANEAHLANGLVLSVECDQWPKLALQKLTYLFGKPTLVVKSGGEWVNPETGELEDKLHLYWRLNEPTRTPEEHRQLKELRSLAAEYVGGDASNKPIVHPIRCPGSWHRKGEPRMAQIISQTENEIDLYDALEKLRDAVGAEIVQHPSKADKSEETTAGEARDTAALVAEITSGHDYHVPLTSLAMRYLKGGMADAQVVLTLRGFMQGVPEQLRDMKDGTLHSGRWQSRYDDISRLVTTARGKISNSLQAMPADDGTLVCAGSFAPEAPPRLWIVDDWIPQGCVTGLFGAGATGKSLLAQQLATILAANYSGAHNDTI